MQFKVGDKVKVIYNSNGSNIVKDAMNKIGVVKSIYCISEIVRMIYVEFDDVVFSDLSCIGFFKNEIKKVNTKGQQLLFSFMNK